MLESKSDVSGLEIFSITPVAQRAGLAVEVSHGFLPSIRCVYKISWSVCVPRAAPVLVGMVQAGHGPVGAAGVCWWPWTALADGTGPVSRLNSIPALWSLPPLGTLPQILFQCCFLAAPLPFASVGICRILLPSKCFCQWSESGPYSKTPPLLSFLPCRSTLCQDVWNPAPGSSWQCHDRS